MRRAQGTLLPWKRGPVAWGRPPSLLIEVWGVQTRDIVEAFHHSAQIYSLSVARKIDVRASGSCYKGKRFRLFHSIHIYYIKLMEPVGRDDPQAFCISCVIFYRKVYLCR